MKKDKTIEAAPQVDEEPVKYNKWAYGVAWFGYLLTIGSAIYSAIKDKKPPAKNEFTK